MRKARSVIVIANPIAGNGMGADFGKAVEKSLLKSGCRVKLVVTDGKGETTDVARAAVKRKVDTVLVCGGDGTVNEALQAVAKSRTALAVLPTGTGNLLAHVLYMSRGPLEAAEVVLKGRRRRLDAGRAAGRYFLSVASVGFDAFVIEKMGEKRRGAINYGSYVRPTLQALGEYGFPKLRVSIDGKRIRRPVYHVIIGNVSNYGGPFSLTPSAKPDDGLLDVTVLFAPRRLRMAIYLAAAAAHMQHSLASMRMRRGRRVDVESESPVAVQLDGDFKTHTPVSFEIVPRAVTVLWPRGE